MADKKTTKVGMITHKGAGMHVQLNVDRDSRRFWAEVSGVRIEHADGKEVERLVLEAIEQSMDIPWTPVIAVSPWAQSGSEYKVFGFHADRIYIANLPNGVGLRQSRWDTKDNKQRLAWSQGFAWRPEHGTFNPPCVYRGYSGSVYYYLPYSEPVWDRLVFIQKQITRVAADFAAILESPDAIARLASLIPLGLALSEGDSRTAAARNE